MIGLSPVSYKIRFPKLMIRLEKDQSIYLLYNHMILTIWINLLKMTPMKMKSNSGSSSSDNDIKSLSLSLKIGIEIRILIPLPKISQL